MFGVTHDGNSLACRRGRREWVLLGCSDVMCPPRLAYRIEREGGGGGLQLLQDCDDDGEDAAGGRMLHLLQVGGLDAWCVSSMVWLVLIG